MEEEKKIEETVEVMTVKLELNVNELEMVYRGLLEIPAKFSLGVIQHIQSQVRLQVPIENPDENESINKEDV
jgi:hypothetical protein